MTLTRMLIVALVATLSCALPAAADAAQRTKPRTVAVDVAVERFAVRNGRPVALATASTVAYSRAGMPRQSSQRTTLAVKTAASGCRILKLQLDDLKLTLLGLTVDTSAVNLNITGRRTGSLGKLFCQLASGLRLKSTARVAKATSALNRRIRHRRLHTLRFRAAVQPQARASQAQTTCPVLDLTLGPLNLDLLGLTVDLYGPTTKDPVKVTITADPNGGSLGKLFCQLSSEAQANSTS
jgi:hypothetical protein